MKSAFKSELKEWMKKILSPYCIDKCKDSCCDCSEKGEIHIDQGHQRLFQTDKLTGQKVRFSNEKINRPRLYKISDSWHFSGGLCPNYNPKTKSCLIYNQHPMCALFPLVKVKDAYFIVSSCELYKMDSDKEPLKSLILIFKKHKIRLFKEENNEDLT